MSSLFAYGTLMCIDIMAEVAGCIPAFLKATLRGYARLKVKGELYPAIVPAQGEIVPGILYRDLPRRAWARLDAFEGNMYERRRVQVETEEGEFLEAQTYVLNPMFADRLGDSPWDLETFLIREKSLFEETYGGYRCLSGQKKD